MALNAAGVENTEQQALFATLAAILHLKTVKFSVDRRRNWAVPANQNGTIESLAALNTCPQLSELLLACLGFHLRRLKALC